MIKIFRKSKLLLIFCKLLFVIANENYFSLLLSLMSMYSLSVSHIFVKLVLMLIKFPLSIFYMKTISLLLYYSFTIMLGIYIIVNKLVNDFAKHKYLTQKYYELHKKYHKAIDEYEQLQNQMKQNKKKKKIAPKRELYQLKKLRFKIEDKRHHKLDCFHNKVLPQKLLSKKNTIDSLKQRLFSIRSKVSELQIKSLTYAFPPVVKLFFFIFAILLLNQKSIALGLFVFFIETMNTLALVKLNTKPVILIRFVKEVFLLFLFFFMLFARHYQEKMSLDHYFDAFNLQYIVLFILLSYLTHQNQKLPKIKDEESKDVI